jgi:hypothetical protein
MLTKASVTVVPAILSASSRAEVIAETVSSISTTKPFLKPAEGAVPIPITSKPISVLLPILTATL